MNGVGVAGVAGVAAAAPTARPSQYQSLPRGSVNVEHSAITRLLTLAKQEKEKSARLRCVKRRNLELLPLTVFPKRFPKLLRKNSDCS